MVSNASFKTSSRQHHVNFVMYGPIKGQLEDKEGYTLGRGHLMNQTTHP